jgi:hypothetical protein
MGTSKLFIGAGGIIPAERGVTTGSVELNL